MGSLLKLKIKLLKARKRFKPNQIKCLLIAEAPPDNFSRFFYYPDVKEKDYLFLGIMEILYPAFKNQYLSLGRPSILKKQLLQMFQNDGFYLIDLLNLPKEYSTYKNNLSEAVPALLNRVSKIINSEVPIIIIKANVYDLLANTLIDNGYNVIPQRIPFPSNGRQKEFAHHFRNALSQL